MPRDRLGLAEKTSLTLRRLPVIIEEAMSYLAPCSWLNALPGDIPQSHPDLSYLAPLLLGG